MGARTHRANRAVGAVALVRNAAGQVLLGRKHPQQGGRGLYAGMWLLPGGKTEPGEKPEQAVVREVAEETGIDVTVLGLIAYGTDCDGRSLRYYECATYDENPVAADDLDEARFVDPSDLVGYLDVAVVSVWPSAVRNAVFSDEQAGASA